MKRQQRSRRVIANVLDLEEILERASHGRLRYVDFRALRRAWVESAEAARKRLSRLRTWLLEQGVAFDREAVDGEFWLVFEVEAIERVVREHAIRSATPRSRPAATRRGKRRPRTVNGDLVVPVYEVRVFEVKRDRR